MNINGQAIFLKSAGEFKYKQWHRGKDKYVWNFEKGDIQITLRVSVTVESGDFVPMDALLTITKGSDAQTMKVTGGCGG